MSSESSVTHLTRFSRDTGNIIVVSSVALIEFHCSPKNKL